MDVVPDPPMNPEVEPNGLVRVGSADIQIGKYYYTKSHILVEGDVGSVWQLVRAASRDADTVGWQVMQIFMPAEWRSANPGGFIEDVWRTIIDAEVSAIATNSDLVVHFYAPPVPVNEYKPSVSTLSAKSFSGGNKARAQRSRKRNRNGSRKNRRK